LSLGEIHVGKTEIKLRLELVVEKGLNLFRNRLTCLDGLLCDPQDSGRLQCSIKGLIDGQYDLLRGGYRILLLGSGAQIGTGHQIRGAPEVRDQLADRRSARRAVKNNWVIQTAGGDAAVLERIHAS